MSVIDLTYSGDVAAETDPIFRRVEHVIPRVEWPLHAPYVAAINRLKRERNAVILAHNYQVPEIFYTVADIVGDSLALAIQASQTQADVIVLCGVHFMAETAKLVNPTKTVLVPDLKAGCSLAESITGADVRLLREKYPGVPVVTYVNTSAEVKAESDVCVTSGNALQIVEALGVPKIIFLPDEYLAKYVASTSKSSPGRAIARCTSALKAATFGASAKTIRRSLSSRIRNARPTCWRRPISSARPRA
jgi:quinolinate synthase